jgi:hypothetical protein
VRISWAEALDTIAARFRTYIDQFGPESLLFVTLPGHDFWARFMNALGVVNRIDHIDECFLTDNIIQRYTTGGKQWTNDFDNSKYILLFGWDQVAKNKIVYANGIVKARANGAKVVRFAPTYTTTSKLSTEYHNIRPGSDLAVALAMINVIISENLYDRDFVAQYTNFPQHESQIRSHFAEYTPQWAEGMSDVPAADIARIAREFATTRPAIAPAHKKTLCANYMNATQLSARHLDSQHPGRHHRPSRRPLFRARHSVGLGVDAIWPPPAYPAKQGRRIDGRNKLPLAQEMDQGMFSTLADGMLNKHPGMIKAPSGTTTRSSVSRSHCTWKTRCAHRVHRGNGLPAHRHGVDGRHRAAVHAVPGRQRDCGSQLPRDVAAGGGAPARSRADVRDAFDRLCRLELGKRLAPDYFKKPDGSWINANELLDEKVKRAGLGDNFAEFRAKGKVERPAAFTPRTSFGTVGGTNKCQILRPAVRRQGRRTAAQVASETRAAQRRVSLTTTSPSSLAFTSGTRLRTIHSQRDHAHQRRHYQPGAGREAWHQRGPDGAPALARRHGGTARAPEPDRPSGLRSDRPWLRPPLAPADQGGTEWRARRRPRARCLGRGFRRRRQLWRLVLHHGCGGKHRAAMIVP